MPSGTDQGGKKLVGHVLWVDVVFAENKGRTVRCRMKVIEEEKVAIADEDRRDPFVGFGSLRGKLQTDFIGSALELPGQDVRVAHVSQCRPEPFEVTPDVAHPHRIESDVEGAQVRAEPTGGYS